MPNEEEPPEDLPPLQFDDIWPSQNVISKIHGTHHISTQDIEQALDTLREPRWEQSDTGTWRALAFGKTETGRELKLALYPADDPGQWRLGTVHLR